MTLLLSLMLAAGAPPQIYKSLVVPAPAPEVWKAFTSKEGVQTFFAPDAKIELKKNGAYELYFVPEAPAGSKGSEGCQVLQFEAPRKLQFSWNFPPTLPAARARGDKTKVTITLIPEGEGTRLSLSHDGWQASPEHEQGRAYFDKAWTLVLMRLKKRFVHGPMDWKKPWVLPSPESLSWMVGTWNAEGGAPQSENWVLTADALVGTSRDAVRKPASHALSVIELEGDELALRARNLPGWAAAPEPKRLVLVEQKEGFAKFAESQGSIITYALANPTTLAITVDKPGAVETFNFVKSGSAAATEAPKMPEVPKAPEAPKPVKGAAKPAAKDAGP